MKLPGMCRNGFGSRRLQPPFPAPPGPRGIKVPGAGKATPTVTSSEGIRLDNEPNHDALCQREQEYFLNAILNNTDLTRHVDDAINSMRIVLAADESFRTGRPVEL